MKSKCSTERKGSIDTRVKLTLLPIKKVQRLLKDSKDAALSSEAVKS